MAGFPNYNVPPPPPPVQIVGAPPVAPQQPMQPPQNLGAIQAQIAEGERQRQLAAALMSTGYVPNSGALGSIAQIFSAFAGKKLDKKAGESVADAAAREFAEKDRLRLEEIDRENAQWETRFKAAERAALAKARIAAGNKTYQVVDAGAAGLMYNTPNGLVPVSQGMPNRGQPTDAMPEQGSMEAYVAAANMLREAGVPPDQIEVMLADAPGMMPADEDNQPEVGQQYVGGAPSGTPAPGGPITSSSWQRQQEAERRANEQLELSRRGAARADEQLQLQRNPPEKPMSAYQKTQLKLKIGKAKGMLRGTAFDLDRLQKAADELLKEPGLDRTTGIVGAFPNYPGGKAADAEAKLKAIKSQIGFAVLQKMRAMSPTGGALGNVSDNEGARLEANIAALDKAQSYEQMREALTAIKDYAQSSKDALEMGFNDDFGEFLQDPSLYGKPAAAPGSGGYTVGQIIEKGGKRYRVISADDPNDPEVEPLP